MTRCSLQKGWLLFTSRVGFFKLCTIDIGGWIIVWGGAVPTLSGAEQ